MIPLDAATVFVGWAAGCLGWQVAVGARRAVVFGAAWVIRVFAIVLALCSLAAAAVGGWDVIRDGMTAAVLVLTVVALVRSIFEHRAFRAQIDALVDDGGGPADAATPGADRIDLVAALIGAVALLGGLVHAGGPLALALARGVVGASMLGGLTFTMVFGHRMLAKPYLGRGPLEVGTNWLLVLWPLEVLVMVVPTGMVSVLDGSVDDGYGGIMGWMWAMCAISTGVLLIVARLILQDREESKPASATGMLYLAALTGFGAVLISRAVLSS